MANFGRSGVFLNQFRFLILKYDIGFYIHYHRGISSSISFIVSMS